MEVTGIMRQTVENALASVSQVNLASLDAVGQWLALILYGVNLRSMRQLL